MPCQIMAWAGTELGKNETFFSAFFWFVQFSIPEFFTSKHLSHSNPGCSGDLINSPRIVEIIGRS